jgi:hypothetical protein
VRNSISQSSAWNRLIDLKCSHLATLGTVSECDLALAEVNDVLSRNDHAQCDREPGVRFDHEVGHPVRFRDLVDT